MRAHLVGIIAALGLAAGLQSAAAVPSLQSAATSAPVMKSVPAASHKCGKGQRWVPAGYAKHGKYRAGHCAPV